MLGPIRHRYDRAYCCTREKLILEPKNRKSENNRSRAKGPHGQGSGRFDAEG